jgi:hypothetical protein
MTSVKFNEPINASSPDTEFLHTQIHLGGKQMQDETVFEERLASSKIYKTKEGSSYAHK